MYYDTFPYFYTGYFDTFSDLSLTAAGEIKRRPRVISQAACSRCTPPLKPHDVKRPALVYAFRHAQVPAGFIYAARKSISR